MNIIALVIAVVVVICISAVAIKIAIIWFLSKAVRRIPNYAHTEVTIIGHAAPNTSDAPYRRARSVIKPKPDETRRTKIPALVTDSELEAATMERFLEEMAKERLLRFSSDHLRGFTRNFSAKLGAGAFGEVYKGSFPSGVRIAVKVLKNGGLGRSSSSSLDEQFMAEVATIGRTYHINLVRLYGFCFDPTLQALVYEYMENGSLDKFLFSNDKLVEWGKLVDIAIGTARGIVYLHEECEKRIIHYDIKPGNVLLDSNLNPKVADFGLAKLCNRDSTQVALSGMKGTPGYTAPEVWMPYPVTYKCDVYSFGMLLFEIVGRRRNYLDGGRSSREFLPKWVYEKVERKEVEEMLSSLEIVGEEAGGAREKVERAVMVALWCVQYLPAFRPKMSDVVRMLEGGDEIPTPPNPFAHLASNSVDGITSWSTSHS